MIKGFRNEKHRARRYNKQAAKKMNQVMDIEFSLRQRARQSVEDLVKEFVQSLPNKDGFRPYKEGQYRLFEGGIVDLEWFGRMEGWFTSPAKHVSVQNIGDVTLLEVDGHRFVLVPSDEKKAKTALRLAIEELSRVTV